MVNKSDYFKLYNGVMIPSVGYGCWQVPTTVCTNCVKYAIEVGYTHIDTAIAYGNEKEVGIAIRESKIKREDIFVTTKVPAEVKTYEGAKQAIESSLKSLDIGYIDLILIHSPKPWEELWDQNAHDYYKENLDVWRALCEAYIGKKVRAIGISNFQINDIKNIVDNSDIKPMVNQICIYAGNTNLELIKYCQDNNIVVEAYSPNATGRLKNNPVVVEMAKKYNVSVPRLGIRYCMYLDTLPLPKSVHNEYILENLDLDFEISKEDIEILKSL